MNQEHLKFLQDPYDGGELKLEIVEYYEGSETNVKVGFLIGEKFTYEILNGIPRFVKTQGYSGNFGMQWKRWPRIQYEENNIGTQMEGYTRSMWERINNSKVSNVKADSVILDVGCGSGRFLDLFKNSNCIVIGVDYSESIDVVGEIFGSNENYLLVQGDALNLPIVDCSADVVYSIGVLHHTPSPKNGLQEMTRVCKEFGKVSLAVYGKGSHYDYIFVTYLRNFFKVTYPYLGFLLPTLYSYLVVSLFYPVHKFFPIIGKLAKRVVPFIYIPSYKWSLLDTFDSITPSFQSTHTSHEVYNWFLDCGLKNIIPSDWGFTSYSAEK